MRLTKLVFQKTFNRRLRKGEYIEPLQGSRIYRINGKEVCKGPGTAWVYVDKKTC